MLSRTNSNGKGAHGTAKPAVPSVLSADLRIVGNLTSEGEIHIDGTVDGDIRSRILLVGETAVIKGEIEAQSVTVHGTVLGQIRARSVSLARTARVTGDVLHEVLAIEKGAYLEGHCRRLDRKAEGSEAAVVAVARSAGDGAGAPQAVRETAVKGGRGSIAAARPAPAI